MPRYFFHLTFGRRTVPDEEGVELPDRTAAREEALAVVRDLANPELRGNPRRWASWFLEVADATGGFFRTPIGHPALEIASPQTNTRRAEEPESQPLWPARSPSRFRRRGSDRGDRSGDGRAPASDGATAET